MNKAEENKKDIQELFDCCLVDTLNLPQIELLEDLNDDIIDLIADDAGFQTSLENALYNSKEKLTHKEFELDKKKRSPSVKNWLKYFIKSQSSSMFDNVKLSSFITNAENAKRLDENEKKLLKKLLQLYRNLKFFPESQAGVPEDRWEIFPVNRLEALTKARNVSGPPKTKAEEHIDQLKKEEEKYSESSLQKKVINEEIDRERELGNLKYMREKYKIGSLERKAVDEEINRLQEN